MELLKSLEDKASQEYFRRWQDSVEQSENDKMFLHKEVVKLRAEVERLKQSLEIYEAEYGNPPHKPSNYVLKLANSELQMQNRKYKAALERIASLAERQALQGTLDGFAAKEMEIIAREALKETK